VGWIDLGAAIAGVVNDGDGNLSGYGWGENVGWISFSCANTDSCGTVQYGVVINPGTGEFSGKAWGENIGWINFAPATGGGARTSWRNCADADADGYLDQACGGTDCDDTDPEINPGADEVCDGVDNNCAGGIDEEPAASASCDNGQFCDGQETCSAGSCQAGTPVDCDDGLFCNGVDTCDEGLDLCVSSGDPCVDGDVCSDDHCYEGPDECDNPCIATGPADPCCLKPACVDALICLVDFTLELSASYQYDSISLDVTIGEPVPATWTTYLIMTYPSLQVIQLWSLPLGVIDPPVTIPLYFPAPSVGWVGFYSGLFTGGGPQVIDLAWVYVDM